MPLSVMSFVFSVALNGDLTGEFTPALAKSFWVVNHKPKLEICLRSEMKCSGRLYWEAEFWILPDCLQPFICSAQTVIVCYHISVAKKFHRVIGVC